MRDYIRIELSNQIKGLYTEVGREYIKGLYREL